MKYEELKQLFEHRLAKNLKVQSLLDRIRSGKADFRDTAVYSELVSKIFSYLISRNVSELDDAEEITQKLLADYNAMINEVLGEVQMSLDEKTGLHIKPQPADLSEERVRKFAHSLVDPTVPEDTIKRRARSGSENIAKSYHDDFMRKNAAFRSRAGVQCYITRTTDGKCCEWCTKLAGRYKYEDAPDDIFRRHDNCGCSVIYENGRQRQDVWTKKTWEVAEELKVPYQPKVFTSGQAQALQDEKLSMLRGVDNSAESDIMKIKKQLYQMPDEKYVNYSLDPERQPDKAEAFRAALGYTKENYKELMQKVYESLDEKKFVEKGDKGHGMLYEHIAEITGANGKTAKVLTAWIQEGDHKRLVSVYVDKK